MSLSAADGVIEAPIRLSARGISKSFPGVQALKDVDLDVAAGEVLAVCGENGAGKSTLMKVIAGNYRPDAGEIRIVGRKIEPRSPLHAKQLGVLLIHQEISLVPQLSVAENIFLGSLPRNLFGFVDRAKLAADTQAAIDQAGFRLNGSDIVGDLTVAHQQMVEIARAVALNASVVIFDEPTASLTESEARALFETIRRLKASGVAILYISHKLPEILEISDRVMVLRDGVLQGTLTTREADERAITALMIGRHLEDPADRPATRAGAEVLRVEHAEVPGYIEDVSFSAHAGEIVGLYGLVGAGRTELAEVIFGLRTSPRVDLRWHGEPVEINSPGQAVDLGLGLVPEDRKSHGLILDMGGASNITLPDLSLVQTAGFIRRGKEHRLFEIYRQQLQIAARGPKGRVRDLSGGNQQKIVLGKWLATKPELLILDEPTRGVDVGAKAEIHRLVVGLAREGMAIILISSEMPEILLLSDRVFTIHNGKITRELDRTCLCEEALVAGVTSPHSAPGPVPRVLDSSGADR